MEGDFEVVWLHLLQMCHDRKRDKKPICTLVQNAKHDVVDVSEAKVTVWVERSEKLWFLRKAQFKRAWKKLKATGEEGTDLPNTNWIVKVMLAYLPNVEYQLGERNKRIWFLKPHDTHRIGTRKRFGQNYEEDPDC